MMSRARRFGARYPRLLTFWDIVKDFRAALFVKMVDEISDDLVRYRGASSKDELTRRAPQITWRYQRYKDLCAEVGLPTVPAISRVIAALGPRELASRPSDVHQLMTVVHGRLVDDLHAFSFFSMGVDEAERFKNPEAGWGDAPSKFGSAAFDMNEANRCLACGLSTACVFHLCRVAESALRTLAKTLGDRALAAEKEPGWERVMQACAAVRRETVLSKRPPRWREKKDHDFLAGIIHSMEGVQRVWRNPVAHPERPFTEQEAARILPAIQTLVIDMGTRIKERKKRRPKPPALPKARPGQE